MRQLFLIFSLILVAINSFAQIKVIDRIPKNISSKDVNSIYEIRIDELEDSRIKISFRSDTANYLNRDYGYVYLNNYPDFEELGNLIVDGFDMKNDQNIYVDLGDSQLILSYVKHLFGGLRVRFTHSYKNNPYQRKSSKYLSRHDIDKLFFGR